MPVSEQSRRWATASLGALALLALLSGLAATAGVFPLDGAVRAAILNHASPEVLAVAQWVNRAGTWHFLLPAMLLLLAVSRDGRRYWWLWGSVLPLAAAMEGALKDLVGRPRPEGAAMGFPSGHVTAVAGFCILLTYLTGRMRLRPWARAVLVGAAMALVVLVALARVLLNAHWPSDVLGGMALGAGFAAVAVWWHAGRVTTPGSRGARPGKAPARGGFEVS